MSGLHDKEHVKCHIEDIKKLKGFRLRDVIQDQDDFPILVFQKPTASKMETRCAALQRDPEANDMGFLEIWDPDEEQG